MSADIVEQQQCIRFRQSLFVFAFLVQYGSHTVLTSARWFVLLLGIPILMSTVYSVTCLTATAGSLPNHIKKIVPDNIDDRDFFGTRLALAGETLVVAPFEGNRAGYVFRKTSEGWQKETELVTSDGQFVTHERGFDTVATDGATIVVGDHDHRYSSYSGQQGSLAGAVYVFEESESGWTETALLGEENAFWQRYLGRTVAVSGNTIMAGVNRTLGPAGVQVFQKVDGIWELGELLEPNPDSEIGNNGSFGDSEIAIHGNIALIGGHVNGGPSGAGAVIVFEYDGTGWQETDVILPEVPIFRGRFGSSLDVSNGTAIIGRPAGGPSFVEYQGAAFIYEQIEGTWTQTAELSPSDGFLHDMFGEEVVISGNMAAVSAWGGNEAAIYLFQKSAEGLWEEVERFSTGHRYNDGQFGSALAFDGNNLFIGARTDDEFGDNAGVVYFLEIPEPGSLALLALCLLTLEGGFRNNRRCYG